MYWGIIAVAFLKIIYPNLEKLEPLIHKTSVKILSVFMILFMTFDITISVLASNRQQERRQNIEPKNNLDVFLDEHYPDELLDRIYNNKKNVDSL